MKYLKRFKTHSNYEEYINGEAVLPNVSYCEDERGMHYNPWKPHDYTQDYFTMRVTVGGDVTWTGIQNNALCYSKDNGKTWSEPSVNITLSVNEGDKVLWKGETSTTDNGIGAFNDSTDVRYAVEGNIMSLLFGVDFKGQTSLEGKSYAFYRLFYNNKNITSAENLSLPATTLATNCYGFMFFGCSSLVTAPELPATTLADYCYQSMFSGCTSLVTASELPATILAKDCYAYMFDECTNLNYIKCLATDISASNCCQSWVSFVASSGTFVKATSMTSWPNGINGIPSGWTVVDA